MMTRPPSLGYDKCFVMGEYSCSANFFYIQYIIEFDFVMIDFKETRKKLMSYDVYTEYVSYRHRKRRGSIWYSFCHLNRTEKKDDD